MIQNDEATVVALLKMEGKRKVAEAPRSKKKGRLATFGLHGDSKYRRVKSG